MAPRRFRPGKELLIAVALLGFGLFPLPALVYWVGARVVGEYPEEGGLWALIGHIWSDLASGNPLAWILVVSPYLIIQLLRVARAIWRRNADVSSVTVID
jgi:hypothetical protein